MAKLERKTATLAAVVRLLVTIIRLLDGTRAYLHAAVDNFSRRVLARTLEPRLSAEGTRRILNQARQGLGDAVRLKVMTDGGSENLIIQQDADLIALAEHVVVQVDIVQSNSMVEALWSQLRRRWLYLHTLDSFVGLNRLIASYFTDHNSLIPCVELGGRTPHEAYFRGRDIADRLRAQHVEARFTRHEQRAMTPGERVSIAKLGARSCAGIVMGSCDIAQGHSIPMAGSGNRMERSVVGS